MDHYAWRLGKMKDLKAIQIFDFQKVDFFFIFR